ncbi:acyl-CoA thioesterase family protein [Salinimonas marina]|uniref:hypothetical protein n=1 Tax=Salinimonas marina TaxID=2785918 RepID=UPI001E48509A|nr:hypothetical protein [Salinimonas marina]
MTDFAPSLADYPYRVTLDTRPQDCVALGNINNVVFYSFFDSAVNQFLVEQCQLDYTQARLVPFVSVRNVSISPTRYFLKPLPWACE